VSNDPFSGCRDLSFNSATCACRPDAFTSCELCATPQHVDCVWVSPRSAATMKVSVETPTFSTSQSRSYTFDSGFCWGGSAIGPSALGQNMSISRPSEGRVSIELNILPKRWFWGQCTIANGFFISALTLVTMTIIVVCACCCWVFIKGGCRRRKRTSVFQASRSSLLHATSDVLRTDKAIRSVLVRAILSAPATFGHEQILKADEVVAADCGAPALRCALPPGNHDTNHSPRGGRIGGSIVSEAAGIIVAEIKEGKFDGQRASEWENGLAP